MIWVILILCMSYEWDYYLCTTFVDRRVYVTGVVECHVVVI
jgi:hypothetical protein